MEISFKNKLLRDLYEGRKVNNREFRSNPSLVKKYIKTVERLKAIYRIEQLHQYHGIGYEKLKRDRKGYSAVKINDQYRLIFLEIKQDHKPFEVVLLELQEISKHYE